MGGTIGMFWLNLIYPEKTLCPFFKLKNENSKLQCKSNIDARLIFNFSLLALNVLIFKKLPTTSYFGLFFERLKLKRRKRFEKQIFSTISCKEKTNEHQKRKSLETLYFILSFKTLSVSALFFTFMWMLVDIRVK